MRENFCRLWNTSQRGTAKGAQEKTGSAKHSARPQIKLDSWTDSTFSLLNVPDGEFFDNFLILPELVGQLPELVLELVQLHVLDIQVVLQQQQQNRVNLLHTFLGPESAANEIF